MWAEKINSVISKAVKVVQAQQLFRALPQLVSRIMHSNKSAYELLQILFCKVFAQFPHAVLWALLAVVKSSVVNRQKRGVEVMMKLRKDTANGHLCKVQLVSYLSY